MLQCQICALTVMYAVGCVVVVCPGCVMHCFGAESSAVCPSATILGHLTPLVLQLSGNACDFATSLTPFSDLITVVTEHAIVESYWCLHTLYQCWLDTWGVVSLCTVQYYTTSGGNSSHEVF